METWIKINNNTAGRDKLARFFQYLSRFLWHRLQHNSLKNDVQTLKTLEYQLSTFRKLLRFGRFFENLYSSLSLLDDKNWSVRYVLVLSKIANSLFLLADHVLWLGRADVCSVNINRWSSISNKNWLFSITLNLIRDFYEISQLDLKYKVTIDRQMITVSNILTMVNKGAKIVQYNDVFLDTIKNGCDIFIPLAALGYVKFSPGTIGLFGTMSSLIGLWVLINHKLKLSPS